MSSVKAGEIYIGVGTETEQRTDQSKSTSVNDAPQVYTKSNTKLNKPIKIHIYKHLEIPSKPKHTLNMNLDSKTED